MSLSLDLRKRVIQAYETKEGSIRTLAIRFSLCRQTVFLWLKKWREEKTMESQKPKGRASSIKYPEVVEELLREENDATLLELSEKYQKKTGMAVSIHSLFRQLKKRGITRKKRVLSR